MSDAAAERLALHALDKESLVSMVVELRAACRPRLAPETAEELRELVALMSFARTGRLAATALRALLDWHDNAGRVLDSHLKPRSK